MALQRQPTSRLLDILRKQARPSLPPVASEAPQPVANSSGQKPDPATAVKNAPPASPPPAQPKLSYSSSQSALVPQSLASPRQAQPEPQVKHVQPQPQPQPQAQPQLQVQQPQPQSPQHSRSVVTFAPGGLSSPRKKVSPEEYAILEDRMVSQLLEMGYPLNYVKEVVSNVDMASPVALHACFHWMEDNPLPEDFLSDENQRRMVETLTGMGFTEENSIRALRSANNDLQRAIVMLLSEQSQSLKQSVIKEQQAVQKVKQTLSRAQSKTIQELIRSRSSSDCLPQAIDPVPASAVSEAPQQKPGALEQKEPREVAHHIEYADDDPGASSEATLVIHKLAKARSMSQSPPSPSSPLDDSHDVPPLVYSPPSQRRASQSSVSAKPMEEKVADGTGDKRLASQIVELQEMVLSYQDKYINLKKKHQRLLSIPGVRDIAGAVHLPPPDE